MTKPSYKSLQRAIARDDKHSIERRWEYGRAVLADPKKMANSGDQLRAGAIEALIADARAVDSKLSEREIRYRLQCARAYKTVDQIRHVCAEYEDWSALRAAGFPEVAVDEIETDPEDLADAIGEDDPLTQEPLFDIPGFKPVLKIQGRKTDLADATVRDAIAYRDMCREMHANFGRTVAQVEASVQIMLDGADGDLDAKLIEAYERGIEVAS